MRCLSRWRSPPTSPTWPMPWPTCSTAPGLEPRTVRLRLPCGVQHCRMTIRQPVVLVVSQAGYLLLLPPLPTGVTVNDLGNLAAIEADAAAAPAGITLPVDEPNLA